MTVHFVTIKSSGNSGFEVAHMSFPTRQEQELILSVSKNSAEKNTKTAIKRMLVDRGFRGHDVQNAEVLISYTKGLAKNLKRALKRRQAIEPWIGHMKQDGKLGRCHLKGIVGDKIHATLVAIGHNFRTILRKLRFFYVFFLAWAKSLFWVNEQKNGWFIREIC